MTTHLGLKIHHFEVPRSHTIRYTLCRNLLKGWSTPYSWNIHALSEVRIGDPKILETAELPLDHTAIGIYHIYDMLLVFPSTVEIC